MSICFAISDIDFELTKDVVSIIGGVVAALGVVAAAAIGCLGLSTWRKQIKSGGDHELARKILISVYKYRESVKSLRYPIMVASETAPDENEAVSNDPNIERFAGTVRAYERRLKSAESVRIFLLADLLEAEALWGGSLKPLIDNLVHFEREFGAYLRSHLGSMNPYNSEQMRESHREILKTRRDVLFDDMSDKVDDFTKEFNGRINEVEVYLKRKLIR